MNQLQRHVTLPGAVLVGLAAMIGGGVFVVWGPAAAAAGDALLIALVLAGVVATLNALSTAQLATAHPVSGGVYAYGNAVVGPAWGFSAGWLFMLGKTASAGAVALAVGQYLWPELAHTLAVAVIAVLTALNISGVRTTVAVSGVIVTIVVIGILVSLGVGVSGGAQPIVVGNEPVTVWNVLRAAALLFVAFAGYARMATLGEEVRDPRRTLPRAILLALAIVLVLYGLVGSALLGVLGSARLAASPAPLAELVAATPAVTGLPVALAALAGAGALLGLLAGLSRTGLAMARGGDLPGPLARISSRGTPLTAEITVGALAALGTVLLDVGDLIAFSACSVLGYYAIAHVSALRQPAEQRWVPRWVSVLGLIACAVLAVTLPLPAVLGAAGALALGLVLHALRRRARVGSGR